MNYIFAGDRDISVWVLQDLINAGHKPVAIMIVEDSRQTHAKDLIKLSGLSKENIIVGKQTNEPDALTFLRNCKADYIIGIHYPYIITEEILNIPRIGFVNLHPAFLPYNRGWHTPSWAILNNTPIGATLHFMSSKVDMGDVIAQKKLDINFCETANILYQRLKLLERELFRESIPLLSEFKFLRISQNPLEGDSHRMKQLYELTERELKLDRSYKGEEIIRLLRAFSTNNLKEAMYVKDAKNIHFLRLDVARYPLRENPRFVEYLQNVNSLYEEYLASGKKYGIAKKLYEQNEELLAFVRENALSTDFSDPLIFQLIEHIIGWKNQFMIESKMALNDENVFTWIRWSHVPPFPIKLLDV
jgi:methionyl-tRNA formyltransferase